MAFLALDCIYNKLILYGHMLSDIVAHTHTHTYIYIYVYMVNCLSSTITHCAVVYNACVDLLSFAPEDSVSPIVFYIGVSVCELCTFAHVYMYECMLYMYIVRYAVDTIGNKVPVAAARVTFPVTRLKTHTWL